MYKVTANSKNKFEITFLKNGEPIVNGRPVVWDRAKLHNETVHILYNHHSYTAKIVEVNNEEKLLLVLINNRRYQVTVKDRYDELLVQLGFGRASGDKIQDVKAPMPGLVLSVAVKEAQPVKKGDPLLVLEAMKMENIIKSPAAGVVRKIYAAKGSKVEKNEVLVVFE